MCGLSTAGSGGGEGGAGACGCVRAVCLCFCSTLMAWNLTNRQAEPPTNQQPTMAIKFPRGRVAELVGAGEVLKGERDALLSLIQVRRGAGWACSGERRRLRMSVRSHNYPTPNPLTHACARNTSPNQRLPNKGPAPRVRVIAGRQGRAGGRAAGDQGAHDAGGELLSCAGWHAVAGHAPS